MLILTVRHTPLQTLLLACALLSLCGLQAACSGGCRPEPPQVVAVNDAMAAGIAEITAERTREHVAALSSDSMKGRHTENPEYMQAAQYVAARFEEFGLEPGGADGTYFQPVPMGRFRMDHEKTRLSLMGPNEKLRHFSSGLRLLRGSGERTGPIAFISAIGQNASLEDPSILDGRIVFLAARDISPSPLTAQLKSSGALAVFRVRISVGPRSSAWSRPRLRDAGSLITARVSREIAVEVAKATGVDLAMTRAVGQHAHIRVQTIDDWQLSISAQLEEQPFTAPNVIGIFRGSDPERAHEAVVCGAHLDHLGEKNGEIYNGADDNASGVAALLSVAQAIASLPELCARSVVFVAFTGEELGLLGSSHYVKQPVVPLKDTIAMMQMDMIGRSEEDEEESAAENAYTLHLIGAPEQSPQLHDVIKRANRHTGFSFEYDEQDSYKRSDHFPFAEVGLPVAFFFSGFHPDYHQATDTVDKIEFDRVERTARLFYLSLLFAAQTDDRFDAIKPAPAPGADDLKSEGEAF